MKYVKATVVRLNYLLDGEGSMKGMIIQLLNEISSHEQPEVLLEQTAERMNLADFGTLTEKSLYRKRAPRKNFIENLQPEEAHEELSKEDILRLNQIHRRYSRRQIEEFLEMHVDPEGNVNVKEDTVRSDEDFEKLILAYDYAGKKNSRFMVNVKEEEVVDNGTYVYPKLTFIRRGTE